MLTFELFSIIGETFDDGNILNLPNSLDISDLDIGFIHLLKVDSLKFESSMGQSRCLGQERKKTIYETLI